MESNLQITVIYDHQTPIMYNSADEYLLSRFLNFRSFYALYDEYVIVLCEICTVCFVV